MGRLSRLGDKLQRLGDAGPGSRRVPPRGEAPPPVDARDHLGPGADVADALDPASAATRGERVERLRALLRRTLERPRAAAARPAPADEGPGTASAALPGEVQDTAHGPLHVLDRWFEPRHHHGRVPVADALGVAPATLASLALDDGLRGVDPRRLLFLDTETTGLAGGTGTVPFLVGLGWFEDESFRCEQLLLRRLGEEAPILERLAERVREASGIVTFNGKSFDWPLLRTRAVLARVPLPTPAAHLDLLHCARRVYRPRMPDGVRLVQLEQEVLGMAREHDVDGAEIPGLYFAFLRGVEANAMGPILEHNALDLLALAALIARLGASWESDAGTWADDPRDQLGLAGVARRAGDPGRAWAFARAAVDAGELPRPQAHRGQRLVAELARRRGDVAAEGAALEAALELAEGQDVAATHLALAKHHEHRSRHLGRALDHARRTAAAEGAAASAHRVARLERRIAGASPRGSAGRRVRGDAGVADLRVAAGEALEALDAAPAGEVPEAVDDVPVGPDHEDGGFVRRDLEALPDPALLVDQDGVEAGAVPPLEELLRGHHEEEPKRRRRPTGAGPLADLLHRGAVAGERHAAEPGADDLAEPPGRPPG